MTFRFGEQHTTAHCSSPSSRLPALPTCLLTYLPIPAQTRNRDLVWTHLDRCIEGTVYSPLNRPNRWERGLGGGGFLDSLPSDAHNFFFFLLGIVKIKCISTTVVLERLMTMIQIKGR